MPTVLSQSDTHTPFSDYSVTFILPRTLGFSFSAGAAKFESDDVDYVSTLFNPTAMRNSIQLLEQAKIISDSNCLSIPDASLEDGNNILAMRSHEGQIELQGKRARHRRPGLPGADRGGHVFNFSAKATTVEFSQMGKSDNFFKRPRCVETNSQPWPVIDYSCLEHISDPMEYFSTYRMLENAEKEVRKLKGESSPTLNQSQGRRDRQRRPGLPDLEGKKNVFKFPNMTGTVEDSQMENSTQSNGASLTELTITSCSKEISQIKNSQTVKPESILAGDEETCDSIVDKETDELERLLSKCRNLDNDGIASFVRETLQINPIHVKKSGGLPFNVPTENTFESPQLSQILPAAKRNKIDGMSNMRVRLSLIIREGDPFLPNGSDRDKQSDGSAGLNSNCKVFCDNVLDKLLSSERGMQTEDLGKLTSDCNGISVDGIAELVQESLKTKLLEAEEMANPVDHLSVFKEPIPLIDIQGRLAKISTLKRHMLQNTFKDEQLMFSNDGLEDSSVSKRKEMHSVSPVDTTHLDNGSMDQNGCIVLSNRKKSNFEDKMHSAVAEISEEDWNHGKRKISDHIDRQSIFLEDTYQSPDGTISDEEFVSIVSGANFEKAGQSSASVNHRSLESLANHSGDKLRQPFVSSLTTENSDIYRFHCTSVEVNSDAPEQTSLAEALEDESLPDDPALIDEQFEAPGEVLNEKNKEHSKASGGPSNNELEIDEPPCRRRKQNSILKRKSLAGHGSAWESGVRRSTRIRVKPLQFWCGERFLYGRVHDSLATVIGVKKYETPPPNGGKTVMKVKSYVSDEYADLVAQAALH